MMQLNGSLGFGAFALGMLNSGTLLCQTPVTPNADTCFSTSLPPHEGQATSGFDTFIPRINLSK